MKVIAGGDDAGIEYRQALVEDLQRSPLIESVIDMRWTPKPTLHTRSSACGRLR